jgi:hypothetical protein
MWSEYRRYAPRASSLVGVVEEGPCKQRHDVLGYHGE